MMNRSAHRRARGGRAHRLRAARWLVTLALLTLPAPLAAQTEQRGRFQHGDPDYESWLLPPDSTPADAAALRARWQALAKEIETTTDSSAGTYRRYGAMRAGVLRWVPNGGYVYLYVYENFSVIDFSYGRVEATDSEVVLKPEREPHRTDRYDRPPLPRRWVVAKLEGADYFVPAGQMRDFGHYVAGLGRYNDFNGPCCEFAPFFVKEGEVPPGVDYGRPRVPHKYARLMLKPIEAQITSVAHRRKVKEYQLEGTFYGSLLVDVTLTSVAINAGREHGVRRNLLFRIQGAPVGQYLKITRVGRRHSDGVLIRNLDDAGRETCYIAGAMEGVACPPVAVGSGVTTSPL
jgi:hypothetical protein